MAGALLYLNKAVLKKVNINVENLGKTGEAKKKTIPIPNTLYILVYFLPVFS